MNFPQDPILLMSITNTLLRDQYDSLEALCEDREWNAGLVRDRLADAGFTYQPELNQFR